MDVAGGAGAASAGHERRSESRSNGAAAGKGNRGGDHTPQSSSGQQQLQFPNHKILPQHVTITAQQLLPTSVLRNLYDKLYEKRKAAALEVEQIVKSLAGAGDLNRVHALLSLLVSGKDMGIIAIIGIILLIGIVKKNAIMMIDFALEAERSQGMSPADAIFHACVLRFRPILMTTMAALLGALPLALGHGDGAGAAGPVPGRPPAWCRA